MKMKWLLFFLVLAFFLCGYGRIGILADMLRVQNPDDLYGTFIALGIICSTVLILLVCWEPSDSAKD